MAVKRLLEEKGDNQGVSQDSDPSIGRIIAELWLERRHRVYHHSKVPSGFFSGISIDFAEFSLSHNPYRELTAEQQIEELERIDGALKAAGYFDLVPWDERLPEYSHLVDPDGPAGGKMPK